ASRGLSREEWERFEIGFAPDRWDFAVGVLRGARIAAELGETAGILSPRESGGHYDRLRGRVTFPIRDARGRVLGFGGRALAKEQEPKYLNTPETPVFHKREALYGLPKALEPIRRNGYAVVVEGYFDQIALCRAGVECAVATNGTALTPDHARALLRRTRNVMLLFDGDAAGERALERALEVLLPEGLRVRAAELPAKEDPDSLLRKQGPDALRAVIDAAVPALDLIIDRAASRGHETPWQKADAVAAVAPLLMRVPTALDRGEYCARLAMAVGTEVRHVEAAVRAAERGEDAREAVPIGVRRSGPEERNVRQLARCLVEHPALALRVDRDELSELLPRGEHADLVLALVDAVRERPGAPAPELAAALPEPSRKLYFAFSAESELPIEERTFDDTVRWLRDQQQKRARREITRQMRVQRDPDEMNRLFQEKQRLQEQQAKDVKADHTTVGPPA
ncbi:MAG TPA: toprim domain-containing protein, partial [Myxococcota bacterium]|nr:toprim domain-containing protein [Myxococcota bacterium]